jgi:hypothetical protein
MSTAMPAHLPPWPKGRRNLRIQPGFDERRRRRDEGRRGGLRFQAPLIYAATEANADAFGAMAKDNDLPLAVKADSVEALIPLTDKLTGMGLKDLVLDPGSRELKQALEDRWPSAAPP